MLAQEVVWRSVLRLPCPTCRGSLILVIGLLLAGLCLGILVLSLPVLGLLLAGFGVSALLLTLGLLRCVLGRVFGVGVILLLLGCLNVGTVGRLVLGLLSRRLSSASSCFSSCSACSSS